MEWDQCVGRRDTERSGAESLSPSSPVSVRCGVFLVFPRVLLCCVGVRYIHYKTYVLERERELHTLRSHRS